MKSSSILDNIILNSGINRVQLFVQRKALYKLIDTISKECSNICYEGTPDGWKIDHSVSQAFGDEIKKRIENELRKSN